MRIPRWLAAPVVIALVGGVVAAPVQAAPSTPGQPPGHRPGNYRPAACNTAPPASTPVPTARCFAEGLARDGKLVQDADAPPATALGPADFRSAYDLPDGGSGRTVAIVDAYGYSTAESDLAVFRAHYGLPPCSSETGCFTKVDQRGGTDYPPQDAGWSVETALDLDAVSAVCPKCKILLVQADTAGSPDLGTAVDTAANLGADAISNSYGMAGELPFESYYDHFYDHPGVAVTVASGDLGNVQSYPATNPDVIAVGGTKLTRDSSARGWHESAWDSGGSGCSLYEPRPDYQQQITTGCPDTRATADLAADADPESGIAVYNTLGQDGWAQWGGTSLASPLVAAMYALAGPSVPGTYPVSYAYRQGAQLHDVTDGSDGFCGDVRCNAGPGWDGPTGVGTPDGVTALTLGASGYLAGTVTDTVRHKPISGATVTLVGANGYSFHAVTDAKGRYRLAAAAGTYRVTGSKFGYGDRELEGLAVTAGGTRAQDFALPLLPTRGVSGTVTDGSGQGWPLYAKITVDGYPNGAVYTDPFTGRYHVDLPAGTTYTLHVVPAEMPGYSATTTKVALPAGRGDLRQDFVAAVDPSSCTAAGYAYRYHGAGTGFEGWSAAQDGWQVSDDAGTGKTWVFDDPGGKGNLTGGSGQFAIVDNWYYPAAHDTSLISPGADLSAQTDPVIGFDTYYYDYGFGEQDGDVYLSLDGGTTWSDVWHAPDTFVQGHVEIPVPQAAGKTDVKVRFRFSGNGNYWELDNAYLGSRSCDPVPGGLVAGTVYDANTKIPLAGATLATPDGTQLATSTTTPDDTALADGYYWLFSPTTGRATFTAADLRYTASRGTVFVAPHQVVHRDWSLTAGHLTVNPASVSATERLGKATTRTFRLTNDGTQPLQVNLLEQDRGYTPAGRSQNSTAPGAPLRRVKVDASPRPVRPHPRTQSESGSAAPLQTAPTGTAWSGITNYPTPIMANVVAENDGLVYSVAGAADTGVTAAAYAYNPDSKSWRRLADLPQPRQAAAGGFVDGKLYVVGGWGADSYSAPLPTAYAYDPQTNTWSRVADLPVGLSDAAAASVNGKLYVVGGCTGDCNTASSAVYRYDPDTDAWTRLADLPHSVVLPACAGAGDGLVCAGGLELSLTYPGQQPSAATYQYVAGSDAWTQVADMPYPNWGMGYAGADGKLQVVGGVVYGSATNQSSEFDPATGTWSALPNANYVLYFGGAACGLFRVGGSLDAADGPLPAPYSEQLPGHDDCASGSDVPWLSANRSRLELAPGQSATVTVHLDASTVSASGRYSARIAFTTDTPYQVPALPVTFTVR